MAVELKNCRNTVILIQYIGDTPPGGGCLFRGVFETPQTERLSARESVTKMRGNVKGFFAGSPDEVEESPLLVVPCIKRRDA